ncbi:hypothetical protein PVAR5_2040 [Paecilomyces variotii No. 5]|uniref:Uncharacterized protein n=1 Tax=Byssochlamys spectabilis (strain No. 5 / NBRC 109023) TaxID=1356009 RepID=V5HUW5_BYSSN|nr:hypothetical protein PVAR5_2040 [Paecilomyces variotii No. 5]
MYGCRHINEEDRRFEIVPDPEGKYILLIPDEYWNDPRRVIILAAISIQYPSRNLYPEERFLQRDVERHNALRSGEADKGIGERNPYIRDFFIPDGLKEWLRQDGNVEFERHQGREFVRAVPLAKAVLRYSTAEGTTGQPNFSENESDVPKMTLLRLLDILWSFEKPNEPITCMTFYCRMKAQSRIESLRLRGLGGHLCPPHGDGRVPSPRQRQVDPRLFIGIGLGMGRVLPPPDLPDPERRR